nr:hypothetical protein [Cellulomonas fimi]
MTQKAEPDSTRADFGANEWLVDELYEQFKRDRNAVDPAWWDFFEGYRPDDGATDASWTCAGSPLDGIHGTTVPSITRPRCSSRSFVP